LLKKLKAEKNRRTQNPASLEWAISFFFFPAKVEKYGSKIQTGIEHCTKKHLKHKPQKEKEREGKKGKTE